MSLKGDGERFLTFWLHFEESSELNYDFGNRS
ncbi:hypothetical protein SAMN04490189_4647 [Pseudomonas koreensis]|nr:hypothetical protein SAMN04490189_4647 [Pseudomonas koreensis]